MKKILFNNKIPVKILFFERSPYMSVELLDLLNNYKIICYNDDFAYKLLRKNWNLSSYLNYSPKKHNDEIENDQAIEILLEDKNFLDTVIKDKKHSKALLFYMNSNMDKLLKNANISMVLPPYKIQEQLGNKLYLSKICKKINITCNKSLVFQKTQENPREIFLKCQNILGLPFVAQGALGASGGDTFLINTAKELKTTIKKLHREFKATRYIQNNIPLSVHICILEDQIIIHGPFLQLIGLPELSSSPFRFGGNDTNQSLMNRAFSEQVRDITLRIAKYVQAKGFRGIFGIDYLWDQKTNTLYPQELNTRLVGLTRLLTGIQKDQGIFPDLIKHIEAFDIPDYSEKCRKLDRENIDLSQHDYSQVIIRNNSGGKINVLRNFEPSIYKTEGNALKKSKSSLFVHDMKEDEVLITYAAQKGSEAYLGEALMRIILKRSVLRDNEYRLEPKAVELIELIRKYMTSKKI